MPTVSTDRQALLQRLIQKRLAAGRATPSVASAKRGGGPFPLSLNQRQLWLHSQLAPDVPLYNEPFTIHRRGPVDTASLTRSLNEVIRRHDILRTTFPIVDGEPVQVIRPEFEIQIMAHQLNSESRAIELATEDALRPFDLARGPLIRARLVRFAETDHRLFLTLHHLIFDGVSIYDVLLPELAVIYEAFSKDAPSPLPPPTYQYADYALWQRDQMGELGPEQQLDYWRDRLGTERPRLTIPADRARPDSPTFKGELYPFFVERALAESLKQLARESGASLYMILLAAFQWFLYRSTGQHDIVIGTVTAGRNRAEFAGTFGFFLNPLVLRTNLAGHPTFRELVGRVRKVTFEALDHADVPFEALARTLDSARDRRRNPFFDVLFSLEPPLSQSPVGWDLTQTRLDVGSSKFDLSLEFDERADGLDGRFVYSTDLFDRATIERMHRDWRALLVFVAEHPDSHIDTRANLQRDPKPPADAAHFVAPRNETEHVLAEIWSELLGSNAIIGATDDFFALGGHSLLIARMQQSIKRRFGRELEMRDIYAHPTVAYLASLL
jgi:Condensation domain/Phosphopantetheine attachment site